MAGTERTASRSVALVSAPIMAATAWAVVQQLNAPWPVRAGTAAVAASVPPVVTAILARRSTRADSDKVRSANLRFWSSQGRLLRIRDIEDPTTLGVKPAGPLPGVQAGEVIPYVPRKIDADLDSALRREPFVLLIGDSAAGKSRSAFEAVRRVLPDRYLVVPEAKPSLSQLLDDGFNFSNSVIWMDDLDTYLGHDGVTTNILDRIFSPPQHDVTVLATIRTTQYDPVWIGTVFGHGGAEGLRTSRTRSCARC